MLVVHTKGEKGGGTKGFNFRFDPSAMNVHYIEEVILTNGFSNHIVRFSLGWLTAVK